MLTFSFEVELRACEHTEQLVESRFSADKMRRVARVIHSDVRVIEPPGTRLRPRPQRYQLALPIPAGAPPSCAFPRCRLEWTLRTNIAIAGWPDRKHCVVLAVVPTGAPSTPPTARGARRRTQPRRPAGST